METNPNNNSLQNNSVTPDWFVVFCFFFSSEAIKSPVIPFLARLETIGRTIAIPLLAGQSPDPLCDGKGEAPSLLCLWGKNVPKKIPVGLAEGPVFVQPLPVSHGPWLLSEPSTRSRFLPARCRVNPPVVSPMRM